MAIRLTFAIPPSYHHPARKLRSAAKRHGLNLTNCKRDAYGYYVMCDAPCSTGGAKINALKRTKRMKLSHVSYAGCDR